MIPGYVFNHLWQSTLFALVVWALTLALRKNRALVRHGLWLAASIKFLLPLSILVSLGNQFPAQSAVVIAPLFITEPSNQTELLKVAAPPQKDRKPAALFALWLSGFLFCSAFWLRKWLRVQQIIRTGTPTRLDIPIPVVSCRARIAPGVFGIFNPVLMLPQGIQSQLTGQQLQTVLAHELCHVRRQDNLAAAIHMLVEAIFWFHPMVWWIETRLVAEREIACDEEVLSRTGEPQAYAEAILKVCRLYLESPLVCVSAINDSNLKRRIEQIMNHVAAQPLRKGRKALLAFSAILTLALPVIIGSITAPPVLIGQITPPREPTGTSIKPVDGSSKHLEFSMRGTGIVSMTAPMKDLLVAAFGVRGFQVEGGPAWIHSSRYQVSSQVPEPAVNVINKDTFDREFQEGSARFNNAMLQLLKDRYHLTYRREIRTQLFYYFTSASGGHKLQQTKDGPNSFPSKSTAVSWNALNATTKDLARQLSRILGTFVLDRTGLTDSYDIDFQWPPDGNPASIVTAMEQQLGLKLEPANGMAAIYVIDRIDKR